MKSKRSSRAGELARAGQIRARLGYRPDDPGFVLEEYARRYGLSQRAALTELQRMVQEGELIKGGARRRDHGGQIRRVNVYRTK